MGAALVGAYPIIAVDIVPERARGGQASRHDACRATACKCSFTPGDRSRMLPGAVSQHAIMEFGIEVGHPAGVGEPGAAWHLRPSSLFIPALVPTLLTIDPVALIRFREPDRLVDPALGPAATRNRLSRGSWTCTWLSDCPLRRKPN